MPNERLLERLAPSEYFDASGGIDCERAAPVNFCGAWDFVERRDGRTDGVCGKDKYSGRAHAAWALAVFPAEHPLCLGMMGMHGGVYINEAIQNADLLLAMGMRFDDRVTGNLKTYSPHSKKIHFEIDPTEINKNVKVDVPLLGDLKQSLRKLTPLVQAASGMMRGGTTCTRRNGERPDSRCAGLGIAGRFDERACGP